MSYEDWHLIATLRQEKNTHYMANSVYICSKPRVVYILEQNQRELNQ